MSESKTIRLPLSKSEFATMLKMVCVADYVINGIRNRDEQLLKYANLFKKIVKFAYDQKFYNLVYYDSDLGEYYPTVDVEDEGEVRELLNDFEDDCFWENLKFRFFEMLYAQERGEGGGEGKMRVKMILEEMELFKQVEEAIEKYGLTAFKLDVSRGKKQAG